MSITARRLNRATLGRQLLLRREPLDVADAVRRVVALQARSAASPYLALWNRLAGFDPAVLDAAFADRTVVKATLMRITLTPSTPRTTRRSTTRCCQPACLAPERPSLHHHRADRRRRRQAPPPAPGARRRVGALAGPALPGGFGPATVQDVAQFILLRRPVVRDALVALTGDVERLEGPDGSELFDVPGSPLPPEDTPAPPRLLPMWDSTLLAYADRSRVIPPPYRRLVIHQNGDVLPTLVVDGSVAGVWRPVDGGIAAMAFHDLHDEAWAGLAAEARALVAFLADREPMVYRRYTHWWDKLPPGVVRVLPG